MLLCTLAAQLFFLYSSVHHLQIYATLRKERARKKMLKMAKNNKIRISYAVELMHCNFKRI